MAEWQNPWGPTEIPLRQHANLLKGQGVQNPWTMYDQNGVAGWDPYQTQAYNQTPGLAGNYDQMGRLLQQQGMQGLGAGNSARNFYQGALGQGPLEMAEMFSNNPQMSGMIDAASRDITRNLGEVQLPGIAGQSAGSGNLGSSRRGMLEGIAMRGAADRMGDISAQLRGNAYNTGLEMGNRNQFNAASALGQYGQNAGGMFNSAANMYGAGNQALWGMGQNAQNQQQNLLDFQRQYHQDAQRLPYQNAAAGMNVLMDPATAFGKHDQTTAMTGSDWINAGIQLTGQAIGAGMNPMGTAMQMGGQALSSMMPQGTGSAQPYLAKPWTWGRAYQ